MEKKKSRSRRNAQRRAPVPVHLLKGEPNPFESEIDHAKVADLTDRVFRSVIGKFGWEQNETGHIEHIGGKRPESRA